MTPADKKIKQAEEHSLRIFEERNRAFRVIFDTVMEVEGASDEDVFLILCRNLIRLCGATTAALATYKPIEKTMTLECVCRQSEKGETPFQHQTAITAPVTDKIVEKFRESQVQECYQHRGCLVDIFSGSPLDEMCLTREDNCYRLSCVRGGKLLVCGLVQLPPGNKLKLKDMIDTFMNLAGLIIQRVFIYRSLMKSEKRYRAVVEEQTEFVCRFRPDLKIIFLNQALAKLTGRRAEELIGDSVTSFIDESQQDEFIKQIQTLEPGRPSMSMEQLTHLPDGTTRWTRWVNRGIFNDTGEVIEYQGVGRDVTERHNTQKALEDSESRLRTFFESMQPGLLLIDVENHRIVDVNPSASEMIGLPKEKIVDSICHKFVCPAEEGNCPITDQGKNLDRQERILITEDGRQVPILKTVSPIMIEEHPHLLESFIDITELKQSRELLKQSEKEKAIILNSLDELVTFQDKELRVIWTNRAASESVGLNKAQIQGRHCYEVWQQRSSPCENCPVMVVMKTGATQEHEMTTPDGRVWYIRGYPVSDEEGNIIGAVEITKNITEQKRAEETMRRHSLVYRSMQEAVLLFDREDKIIDMNPAAEELLEWPRDELLGKTPKIINPPDQADEIASMIKKGLDRDGVWEGELPIITRSGKLKIMSTIISSIYDREGKWIGNVGINRDITVRKRLEDEVIKTQKLESLGILAGGIAHDFNNLLMSIMGNVSLSKLTLSEGSEIRGSLDAAEDACIQARNLTQQLLTFSRGGLPVLKCVSISDLLRDSTRFSLSGSKNKASFSIPENLWPIDADTGQINQVINNLAINAAQAMPDGGKIEVTAKNVRVAEEMGLALKKGNYILLTFQDFGVGIPDKYIGKIFDPYFTTKKQGSGLGLATVYSIIKNHNGLVTVTSDPGTGTTFSVYLPACCEAGPRRELHDMKIVRGEGSILLMDDDESVRTVSSRMLEKLGFDVRTAANGDEAVSFFKEACEAGSTFDAVILDLTVATGMGGEEAAREIKKIDPEARIIVTSGYSTDSILSDYKRYGFCGVIVKPYKIKDLSQLLSRVIPARPIPEHYN